MDETGDSERQLLHVFSSVQKYTHDMKVEDEGDQWKLGRTIEDNGYECEQNA